MELDAFKELWKDAGDNNGAPPEKNEIMDMLSRSSKSPLAKMVRNVIIEAISIVVMFGFVAIYYVIAFKGQFNSVSWVYILSAALFVVYYYRKWRLLHEMQCVSCRVKSNLEKQVRTLERYIHFYLIAGTAILPLLLVFLGILFYYKFPTGAFSVIFPPMYKSNGSEAVVWVLWIVSLTAITGFTYLGNRWFIRRLYGRHIAKLRQILVQMEE